MESALYHTQTQNQNNSSDSDVLVYLLELAVGETPSPILEQELDDKGMGDALTSEVARAASVPVSLARSQRR